ncbi:MAG TPA: potassium channel protein [Bryobacteraceae bacterium]|nr:potassium channel protein [Bryobacteraceae bacterium]
MSRVTRRLGYVGLVVLCTLLVGTVGYIVIEDYPPFDAFYMALITMTTVGYREVHVLSTQGRVFNSVMIFFGVTTMFFAIGMMTQTIIELELAEFFGKRRVKRMIDKLENHYIVCGFGRVGRNASLELNQSGAPFVVIDRNPERVESAIRAGMLAVQADSTRDQTLRDVGIVRARGLVAALATDADNLFVILSARNLNPMLNVAARVDEEEAEEKLRRAGADIVFAPYSNAGYQLAQALLRPHVFRFLDFTSRSIGLDVAIEQVRVAEQSEFASKTLKQMQIRRDVGVIVLAIRRADGSMLFNPPAEAEINGGDFLIVMGEPPGLRRLEVLMAGAQS